MRLVLIIRATTAEIVIVTTSRNGEIMQDGTAHYGWEKGKESDMREFLKALLEVVVATLATLIIVLCLAYIGGKWNEKENQKKYNGGICTKCGGHYIYEQAVAHKYDTDYIYICNICGDMIELDSYIPQERREK